MISLCEAVFRWLLIVTFTLYEVIGLGKKVTVIGSTIELAVK